MVATVLLAGLATTTLLGVLLFATLILYHSCAVTIFLDGGRALVARAAKRAFSVYRGSHLAEGQLPIVKHF